MTDTVLSADGVTKVYQQGTLDVSVLDGVDLQIDKGEQIAIVGSSGTGKSTLLHLLAGLDVPTAGTVSLNGRNLSQLSESERGRLRNETLGFVYQFHHLLPEFTALENVMIPLMVRKLSTEQIRREAIELLERVNLSNRLNHKPGELSGGERQRVAIARALIIRPLCLLADEPTGNIDRHNAKVVQNMMVELDRDLNVALVVATHDLQLANAMTRIFRLENGVLREES
ncbi:MAG: lipoprotein-releasing ABC transporter ATP-binding protein LolD [Acidiferrobacterales bacterium]|nr:lipoprotein-releasing ABC transporter ATP-binding protein LolD [Acidiferrobacterales bacterium]